MRRDAETIVRGAIAAQNPAPEVVRTLERFDFDPSGRVVLLSVGKAAWGMARAALGVRGLRVDRGLVITKYGHSGDALPGVRVIEAGHPLPDENGCRAGAAALEAVKGLSARDSVILLLSGGGSALFECPLVPLGELESITNALLRGGADILELNAVRKRLSAVKGGRFALACAPAKVYAVILSDIPGSPVDMIASGPVSADSSTCEQALAVAKRYGLSLSAQAEKLLRVETPKALDNVQCALIGGVDSLCESAAGIARELGYAPRVVDARLGGEAREAGRRIAREALALCPAPSPLALIYGGETTVHVRGNGKGGRNQELALAAALILDAKKGVCVLSAGSDGTDGPTDAAGGYADGQSAGLLREKGIDPAASLDDNDSYGALDAIGGLLFTGPTGTNVNDLCVSLVKGPF